MKDIETEKLKTNYDYSSEWEKDEKDEEEKLIDKLPKGLPRKGIKGKYIKKKNNVTPRQISNSYKGYFRSQK